MLRILGTSIRVEQQGVSEPLTVWIVSNQRVREVSEEEIETHKEFVHRWIEKEQGVLLGHVNSES